MDNKEQHLNDLLSKVEKARCTDRGVDELLRIFQEEYSREFGDKNQLEKYFFNLKESKNKQMNSLEQVKNRPKLRISAFKTAVYNFTQDIQEAISELKSY